ncbi:MAG: lipocalin family protein [Bacteroidia bacterium]
MKLFKFSIALSFVLFMAACGSDSEDESPQPTYTAKELALHGGDSKYWVLTKELYNQVDITASYQPCELDNVYIFDKYDNYSIDAGPTTCVNDPEPDVSRGVFELDETNNTLTITQPDTSFTANIITLESASLVWEITVDGEVIQKTFSLK